ncbi:MAG: VOC family protein [Enterococcus sp.]
MFSDEMQIMLYVDDVKKVAAFWQALGFVIIDEQEADGTAVIEIGASELAQAHFVLYDRQFIEAHSPEVASNSPSIMFFTTDAMALYKKMQANQVELGDLVQLGERLVFNFADIEGNYFAVSEK